NTLVISLWILGFLLLQQYWPLLVLELKKTIFSQFNKKKTKDSYIIHRRR
ncbi:unnamed protein product, partial [Brassica rapa]